MTSEPIPMRVTVQPSNTEDNPARTAFRPCARGRIKQVAWQFPVGCNGSIHAAVESREGQLAPISGEDIALGGGPPLVFDGLDIPIPDNNPALRLVAWADDGNAFPHVIDVIVVVESLEVI